VAGLAFLALSTALNAQTNSPSAADGFDPNVDGVVYAIAPQVDGKILIGGAFTTVHGVARTNLARLNIDGSVDTTFNPGANDKVTSLVIQPDGKIVVGGYFTTLGVTTRNRIGRLNADGSLDASFNPNLGGFLPPGVEALAIQSDGKIIAGGTFTTVQANGAATATTRNRLARFNADGTLDAGFDPNVDRVVLSIALQADGAIIVGGGFTSFQANGATIPTARGALARLTSSGTVDTTYNPNLNNGVTKVVVQRDGKVIAGGYFTAATPNGAAAGTTVNHAARFNTDGTLDISFNPNVSGAVLALALQSNGGVLIGARPAEQRRGAHRRHVSVGIVHPAQQRRPFHGRRHARRDFQSEPEFRGQRHRGTVRRRDPHRRQFYAASAKQFLHRDHAQPAGAREWRRQPRCRFQSRHQWPRARAAGPG
jgi:uncharacterized delta-60 repeat protein